MSPFILSTVLEGRSVLSECLVDRLLEWLTDARNALKSLALRELDTASVLADLPVATILRIRKRREGFIRAYRVAIGRFRHTFGDN